MTDIDRAIGKCVKTGRVLFGARSTLKSAKAGKTKLVILAADCPRYLRQDGEYYCELSEVQVVKYEGSSRDLAAVCGKLFHVSSLSIKDPGESEILKLVEPTVPEEPYGGTE